MIQTFLTAMRFIRYDRTKSIGIIAGILISTFLIGQQLGVFMFLTSLMSSLVNNSTADVWVIDKPTKDVNQIGKIDIRVLSEIKSIPGVSQASPLVIGGATATTENGNTVNILLVGSEPPLFMIGPDSRKIIDGTREDLLLDGAVTTDLFDDKSFGKTMVPGTRFEINGKEAFVAMRTRNVRGFGSAQVYTTIDRARFYGNIPSSAIQAVLIHTEYPDQVIRDINSRFPHLRAWKKKDLAISSIREILGASGIASSTGTMILFALLTGILIIGLTMYSSVLDRLKDYGTMKAIGANFGYLTRLLFCQALFFAITGFILAWILLEVFRVAVISTGLLITYKWYEVAGIFVITSVISIGGMFFALLRLKGVEPASVFRN
ncbi:MAG: FtsX-like permease family protein [Bacteroidales bacterium]